MALGDQSKALRIISINKGWDPTVIPASTSPEGKQYPEESIANFDKAPDPWKLGDQSVGSLPQGVPDTFPDAKAPDLRESKPFNSPDVSRENKNRASSGADPFSGKGGF